MHYSEANLLETWYTPPGASMPVMMHLAECAECESRYERLERKMHALTTCPHERRAASRLLQALGAVAIAVVVAASLVWRHLG